MSSKGDKEIAEVGGWLVAAGILLAIVPTVYLIRVLAQTGSPLIIAALSIAGLMGGLALLTSNGFFGILAGVGLLAALGSAVYEDHRRPVSSGNSYPHGLPFGGYRW
jgi:hypothetical protein